jgi:hypothetical protein
MDRPQLPQSPNAVLFEYKLFCEHTRIGRCLPDASIAKSAELAAVCGLQPPEYTDIARALDAICNCDSAEQLLNVCGPLKLAAQTIPSSSTSIQRTAAVHDCLAAVQEQQCSAWQQIKPFGAVAVPAAGQAAVMGRVAIEDALQLGRPAAAGVMFWHAGCNDTSGRHMMQAAAD